MDRRIGLALIVALAVAGWSASARAQEAPPGSPEAPPAGKQATPARLSFADGNVSFWRPGAQDWAPARVNTPLAAGDQLYVGTGANLEVQIGSRSFLRAGSDTQLAIDSEEPDYLQLRVTSGHLSLDLRSLPSGHTIEVDTPNSAFTVEHSGYYRLEVKDDSTSFISRRGGRASVTPASGQSAAIAPSEEVVVSGGGDAPQGDAGVREAGNRVDDALQVATYVAPEPDAWDRWNYERTDDQIDAVSSRYVSEGVYGADDLDQHGTWRVVPTYGSVWIPAGVGSGWAPYSTGRWIWDPFYGWTWVDDAPWGWAPYHYGRWVHLPGYWAWAPGPVVVRPYYAPALVAFFAGGSFGFGVSFATAPSVGWVALGWGEPCVPWWGPAGFIGHPHWFGWGGPRVAFNQTVINVKNINVYQNVNVANALVTVRGDQFGHGAVASLHAANPAAHLSPVFGPVPVKANSTSLIGGTDRGARPPQALLDRRVVATRAPARAQALPQGEPRAAASELRPARQSAARAASTVSAPQPRIVPAPARPSTAAESLRRPPFGQQAGAERALPPPLPRFDDVKQREAANTPQATRMGPQRSVSTSQMPAPVGPSAGGPSGQRATRSPALQAPPLPAANSRHGSPEAYQASPATRAGRPDAASRELPGEPANRVYRGAGPMNAPAAQAAAHAGGNARGQERNRGYQADRRGDPPPAR